MRSKIPTLAITFHNIVSAIFRDNMRYYAISGDIWRYLAIFARFYARLPLNCHPTQIHRARPKLRARVAGFQRYESRSRSRSHSLRAAVFVGGVNERTFARHVALGWRVRGIVRYCAMLCDIM